MGQSSKLRIIIISIIEAIMEKKINRNQESESRSQEKKIKPIFSQLLATGFYELALRHLLYTLCPMLPAIRNPKFEISDS